MCSVYLFSATLCKLTSVLDWERYIKKLKYYFEPEHILSLPPLSSSSSREPRPSSAGENG